MPVNNLGHMIFPKSINKTCKCVLWHFLSIVLSPLSQLQCFTIVLIDSFSITYIYNVNVTFLRNPLKSNIPWSKVGISWVPFLTLV